MAVGQLYSWLQSRDRSREREERSDCEESGVHCEGQREHASVFLFVLFLVVAHSFILDCFCATNTMADSSQAGGTQTPTRPASDAFAPRKLSDEAARLETEASNSDPYFKAFAEWQQLGPRLTEAEVDTILSTKRDPFTEATKPLVPYQQLSPEARKVGEAAVNAAPPQLSPRELQLIAGQTETKHHNYLHLWEQNIELRHKCREYAVTQEELRANRAKSDAAAAERDDEFAALQKRGSEQLKVIAQLAAHLEVADI
eukprot:m.62345 g.62345  ORF g.62345 m.62345 type:complete len:257 (+) comp13329_c1_seq1:301-1071(+)